MSFCKSTHDQLTVHHGERKARVLSFNRPGSLDLSILVKFFNNQCFCFSVSISSTLTLDQCFSTGFVSGPRFYVGHVWPNKQSNGLLYKNSLSTAALFFSCQPVPTFFIIHRTFMVSRIYCCMTK